MAKLGTRVEKLQQTQGPPPIVFAAQATSYIRLNQPEHLKQWEKDLHDFYGIKSGLEGMVGAASESCSNGCSDDCDIC
jgi:hypothetical protein